MNFSTLTNKLQEAVLLGREVVWQYFKTGLVGNLGTREGIASLVAQASTEVQTTIEQAIVRSLLEIGYSSDDIGFVSEKNTTKLTRLTFLIDPLNGGKNFGCGLDIFGLAVAVYDRNQPIAGVVCTPAQGKVYIAEKGQGAWVKTGDKMSQLRVAPCSLSGAVVNFDLNDNLKTTTGSQNSMISALSPLVRTIRTIGSSAVGACWTAENIFNFAVFGHQKAWNIAAGKLLLEEAAGSMIDWRGMDFAVDPTDISKNYFAIAGHPDSLKQILPYLDINSLSQNF